ncbi:hypothetical protein F4780DRAFT_678960 [Xylariomycetidae sp. FL0641]|nr:hypothetical protein F4780DRAFT_678960 [Xylariomycetidae sp. FL0641]
MAEHSPMAVNGPNGPLEVLFSVDGGWRFWCLAPAKETERVLATCKTMRRPFLLRDEDGCREQQGYCVTSVVTHPEYRRYGLASLLLEYVGDWMDGGGPSMLFTSIGDFYAKRGWQKHPVAQSTLSLSCPGELSVGGPPSSSTRALARGDIHLLCARDVRDVKHHMEKLPVEPNEVHVAVSPTADIVGWLHSRSYFIALKARGKTPQRYGAICDAADTWMYWYHDFRKQQLWIQRVRAPPEAEDSQMLVEALACLLLDALREAREWELPLVVVRNPQSCVLRAMQQLAAETRGVSLDHDALTGRSVASVRLGGHAEADTVRLHFNELYAWS